MKSSDGAIDLGKYGNDTGILPGHTPAYQFNLT